MIRNIGPVRPLLAVSRHRPYPYAYIATADSDSGEVTGKPIMNDGTAASVTEETFIALDDIKEDDWFIPCVSVEGGLVAIPLGGGTGDVLAAVVESESSGTYTCTLLSTEEEITATTEYSGTETIYPVGSYVAVVLLSDGSYKIPWHISTFES